MNSPSKSLVIIINGGPESGKDSLINLTQYQLVKKGIDSAVRSSIEVVRDALRHIGVNVDRKNPATRDLLAEVGNALDKYDNFLVKTILKFVESEERFSSYKMRIYWIAMREPERISSLREELLKKQFPVLTLLVKPSFEGNNTADIQKEVTNLADKRVEEYPYNVILKNSGSIDVLEKTCFYFGGFISDLLNSEDVVAECDKYQGYVI